MFGILMTMTWAVTYVKDGITYYLADIQNSGLKLVWSTKKDKAKKYAVQSAASEIAEMIKKSRKNKKQEINVTQV